MEMNKSETRKTVDFKPYQISTLDDKINLGNLFYKNEFLLLNLYLKAFYILKNFYLSKQRLELIKLCHMSVSIMEFYSLLLIKNNRQF